ncbi:hypothetical protein KOW79_013077 [Hemibagrus wyckioides]|uniref:Uncharacterized protein n=1 Tax=Hemibagrus wyckioides TaxID=337641 RepID=A0A9D3SGV4_9TELE|nr:hypothetical protein KOW79_013077 [Hemibagrus wyckioides]
MNMTRPNQRICYGVCNAALTCVSEILEMLVNVFACGGERYDQAAEDSAESEEGFGLSVEETEPAGTRSSVRPSILTGS